MADVSIASNNERRLAVSDRPPFAAKDDVRFERKPPDRNILDRDRIVDGLKQWGVVLVFVGVVICFSVLLPDTFLTSRNAINILNNSPALILFATGATLALILGEFDLSFPAVADLVAVSVGVLVTSFTWSSGASLCAAMAVGLGCGALVGTIVPAAEAVYKKPGDFVDNAVRENARRTAAEVGRSEIVSHLVKANKVKVLAARYDLDDGKVEFLS